LSPLQELPLQLLPDHELPLQLLPDHELPLQLQSLQDFPLQDFPDQLIPDHDLPLQELPDQELPFQLPPDQELPAASAAARAVASKAWPKMSCSPIRATPSIEMWSTPREISRDPRPVELRKLAA